MERQTVGAAVHQKRKLLSSAMDNVRTSLTRAKNPAPHGGTTRNRGARATVSKIHSSLIKRRAHPPHDMSNNSGDDSSSSNDSSSKDLVISTKEKTSSNVNADSDSSHSSSSSSSSDSASSNHIAEAFSKPVTSRRKSESSLMGRHKSEALVAPKDSKKAFPVHNRAHSLPDDMNISLSEENGESYQPTQMESATKLRDHRRQQRSARARPSMQNNKSDDRAQSEGATKHSAHNSRPSMQLKPERIANQDLSKNNGHPHQLSSRYLDKSASSRHLDKSDDHKWQSMQKHTSKNRLEVPLHELKPSKLKSSRHRHHEQGYEKLKRQSMARAKSSKEIHSKPIKDDIQIHSKKPSAHQELHDSVLTNKAAYLPRDLKPADGHKVHQPWPSMTRKNSDKSSHDLEKSSTSRLSSRHSNSAHDSSYPNVNRESKDRKSRKVKPKNSSRSDSTRPDPPAQSTPARQRRHKAALQRLNELKSSLQSSLSGNKLSTAAQSAVDDADGLQDINTGHKKISKARSMKSSRSALVSEHSSNNLKTKSSQKPGQHGTKKKAKKEV
jgi:hypothetical protein